MPESKSSTKANAFSLPPNIIADQKWVILVAGAGEWWICHIARRETCSARFCMDGYEEFVSSLDCKDRDAQDEEYMKDREMNAMAAKYPTELFGPSEVAPMKRAMEPYKGYFTKQAREEQEKRRQHDSEMRKERYEKWTMRKESGERAAEALPEFMKEMGAMRFYSEEDVVLALKRRDACQGQQPSQFSIKDWEIIQAAQAPVVDPSRVRCGQVRKELCVGWTPPMRIGSQVSNRYFVAIRKLLREDPTAPLQMTVA
ncbi:hypothetical protein CC1G_07237 [Coprinopsis cinerea okayama7|uniref:Uncharacterized protein n=1 Tax=Coprinopsis cinerea (strain Okayama-7 / 130 / ATCC MYA-4618 / FGSC 9003) TaxID=240176 RepID=A8PD16_COPC7|nr:hypothetical protein CC1G_07237 [Coprinopsis cinerea okayama7\|eukprot:XP_001840507.1 hypothetical protein CC1G_07237 [Coprinopsis cinerea okayama7\